MSFIKRLIEDFTAPLEATMTKKPSSKGGSFAMRALRHAQSEFGAGFFQQRGAAAGRRSEGIPWRKTKKKITAIVHKPKPGTKRGKGSAGGRRAGEGEGGTSTSTQSTSTQSTSTPATRTRPARPARPARPSRPARTRKKSSENDDDK
jgi:hypothetical protein